MMEWPRVELGKVAEIRGGSTPRRDNPAYWNGDIPWLTPTDLPASPNPKIVEARVREEMDQRGRPD